jgi:hypothetical protein
MASENSSGGLPTYSRFLLLFLGEAIIGVALYSLFTRIPVAMHIVILVATWIVVKLESSEPSKKSIASASGDVDANASPKKHDKKIHEVVQKIFRSYPPKE